MSSLSNLALPSDVEADDKDFLGGGYILESGLYEYDINMAYMIKSAGGATGINMIFTKDNQQFKQTFWVLSRDDKGNKPTYTNTKTGKEVPLMGHTLASHITFLTLGKTLGELDDEEKVVRLYNFEAKAEVDTKVQVITALLGQKIVLGIMKNEIDVTQKNDTTGKYDTTGKTKFENEVVKAFQAGTNRTVTEAKASADAEFITKWNDKNKGTVRNKVEHKGPVGAPGAPASAPATKSLF